MEQGVLGMEHSKAASPAWGAKAVIPVPELSKQCLASASSAACLGLKHETSVPSFSRNDAHSSRA